MDVKQDMDIDVGVGPTDVPVAEGSPARYVTTAAEGPTCSPDGPLDRAAALEDHIRGLIYGQCVGDAVGLATEFLTRADVRRAYPTEFRLRSYTHAQRKDNYHCCRWTKAAFTDDSDQMILAVQAALEGGCSLSPPAGLFLDKLTMWIERGFVDEATGARIKRTMGIGATVHAVVRLHQQQRATEPNPHAAARAVWLKSNGTLAANGAVMRTSVLGACHFTDMNAVIQDTLAVAKTTHYDPRCSASCVAVTTALSMMLSQVATTGAVKSTPVDIVNEAERVAQAVLLSEHEVLAASGDLAALTPPKSQFSQYSLKLAQEELSAAMHPSPVSELGLDDSVALGYTYKCLASAVSSFLSGSSSGFVAAICDLVEEAGDADTNAAVAGALLGCRLGYRALAAEVETLGWMNMADVDTILEPKVEAFVDQVMQLPAVRALLETVDEPSGVPADC